MWWLALWAVVAIVTVVTAALPTVTRPRYRRVADAAEQLWLRIRPAKPEPIGRPIEEIAASLRRLQQWLDAYADPRPIPGKATKVAAASNAYDRVLIEACNALEIPESLEGTEGFDREAERLRMQAAVEGAGVVLSGRRQAGR